MLGKVEDAWKTASKDSYASFCGVFTPNKNSLGSGEMVDFTDTIRAS